MVPGIGHHIWKLDIGSKVANRKGKQILNHRELSSSGIEPGHSLEARRSFEMHHSFEVLEAVHSFEVRHSFEVLEADHSLEMLEPTLELSVPELKCKPVLVRPTSAELGKPESDSHKDAERFVVLEITALEQRCPATEHFAFRRQHSALQGIVHQPEFVGIQHSLGFAFTRHCSETGCKQLLLIDTFVVFLGRWWASRPSSSDCKVST